MASEELNNHPPPSDPSLPPYPEMIMAAIEALDDTNGATKPAIAKQIETIYGDQPPTHTTLVSHHLDVMKQNGQLLFVKNGFIKPDPTVPVKRGRGRPPKPKTPLPPGTVISPPRPRGRPPKPKDPFFPTLSQPKKKTSSGSASGSGRPRGRPPKFPKSAPTSVPVTAGSPRGRGRPPKVKPAVAPVGC